VGFSLKSLVNQYCPAPYGCQSRRALSWRRAPPSHPRRVASSHDAGRGIPYHHGASADHAVVTDRNSRPHERVGAHPDARPNRNRRPQEGRLGSRVIVGAPAHAGIARYSNHDRLGMGSSVNP